uniref:Transcription factor KAN4 n=1 Tax=Aegilops tauschii subsp. strangulata TaxID=200361 RepID=A0A453HDJ5_AEGTS
MATAADAPDLSLHISPPSPTGKAGSGRGHEMAISAESTELCLGFDMATARQPGEVRNGHSDLEQRLHQPSQIPRFKKSSADSQAGSSGGAARSGNGGKKSSRAPRMRWTTALHAHFVQAVQLLGGHESTFLKLDSIFVRLVVSISKPGRWSKRCQLTITRPNLSEF